MRFLLLHGPGFNSFAERALLSAPFEAAGLDITFWNEPSRLRPEGDPFDPARAFERWTASAERRTVAASESQPVIVIAHCIAALGAIAIAQQHPERVSGLVLVAPACLPWATFRNVLRLAEGDLHDDLPSTAAALGRCADETRTLMDEPMREGLPLVLHDPKIFTHYWANPDRFAESLAAQAAPEAQFDIESFFAVLDDLPTRSDGRLAGGPCRTPTLALFAVHDPIAPHADQATSLLANVPDADVRLVQDAGHFLHLDRPEYFAPLVRDWASVAAPPGSMVRSNPPA